VVPPSGRARTPAPAEGRASSATAEPPSAPSPAGEAAAGRLVLLVDDEEDVRQILGRHFTAAGFRIVEAGTRRRRRRRREAPGEEGGFVLVTDLGMPASGGASFQGGFES